MDARRIRCRRDLLAKLLLAEHLRKLGEELQVLFRGLFGDEQHEHLLDRPAVGRVEGNRLQRPHEGAERVFEALDAAVGYRDTLTEPGRAQALARKKAVENHAASDLRVVLEKLADLLEEPFLARRLDVENDVR